MKLIFAVGMPSVSLLWLVKYAVIEDMVPRIIIAALMVNMRGFILSPIFF